jgi:uncharacterized membrane protein
MKPTAWVSDLPFIDLCCWFCFLDFGFVVVVGVVVVVVVVLLLLMVVVVVVMVRDEREAEMRERS